MSNQFSYDARQHSSQSTKKVFERIGIAFFDFVKALVNFIGDMVKIFLSK